MAAAAAATAAAAAATADAAAATTAAAAATAVVAAATKTRGGGAVVEFINKKIKARRGRAHTGVTDVLQDSGVDEPMLAAGHRRDALEAVFPGIGLDLVEE